MARHDTCRGLVWLKDKRDAPHYFHDTNAKMMIWKPYVLLDESSISRGPDALAGGDRYSVELTETRN